jgi:hypothetical protein
MLPKEHSSNYSASPLEQVLVSSRRRHRLGRRLGGAVFRDGRKPSQKFVSGLPAIVLLPLTHRADVIANMMLQKCRIPVFSKAHLIAKSGVV